MKRPTSEDAPHTLIFIDMLGFAALTEKYRTRVVRRRRDREGFSSASTSPIQGQINLFHNIVDRWVHNESLNGSVSAMLFPDCAFLYAGHSLAAALLARNIMRDCVKGQVPVRMGIGRGTFYPLTLSTEQSGSVLVSRSRFIGTAVVYAHAAEQCGGKGMRIFVHPSAAPRLQAIKTRIRILSLPKPYKTAACELDYLYEERPALADVSADDSDRELFDATLQMKEQFDSGKIRKQYTETLKALNRMCGANGRRIVNIRPKKRRPTST